MRFVFCESEERFLLDCPYPVEEALEEPLERVEAGVDILSVEMFLELGQQLGQHLVVVLLKTKQFWKARNEETCTRANNFFKTRHENKITRKTYHAWPI